MRLTGQYPLRYDEGERARWQAAADAAGLDLAAWIRQSCNRAATDQMQTTDLRAPLRQPAHVHVGRSGGGSGPPVCDCGLILPA
jgi:hypothetical protein